MLSIVCGIVCAGSTTHAESYCFFLHVCIHGVYAYDLELMMTMPLLECILSVRILPCEVTLISHWLNEVRLGVVWVVVVGC